jgi:hypothetical protein
MLYNIVRRPAKYDKSEGVIINSHLEETVAKERVSKLNKDDENRWFENSSWIQQCYWAVPAGDY